MKTFTYTVNVKISCEITAENSWEAILKVMATHSVSDECCEVVDERLNFVEEEE